MCLWVYEYVDVWVCGCVGVCVCLGVWVLGGWVCGWVGIK